MVLIGGTSGNALSSLTAIDQWISTLNSSIAGSARTGYKNSQVTFGGGSTRMEKPVINGALGIQYAEQALNIGSTNIDFSQGQVVASTQFTHLALSGSQNAFFVYSDTANLAATNPPPKYYYSRDGETHQDINGNLVNADGLFLVGKDTNNNNQIVNIAIGSNSGPDLTARIDAHNLGLPNGARLAHVTINDLSSLKYSKYGGTVLQTDTPATLAGTFGVAGAGASLNVRITGSALEASNVQLPSTTVELSLAQKIYNALAKVIQVDQAKLDSIFNLIR
ncbi:hypothetical protein EON78_07675 [bacterium]|nr:MAG: hypothetical protein EON78_07675 [bacterium]